MNTLIIYKSVHHGNTKKVAEAITEVLGAKMSEPDDIKNPGVVREYDLVGFGSGIHGSKHHKDLLTFVDNLPSSGNKRAFIFSTSGAGVKKAAEYHRTLRKKLLEKGLPVIGEFACKGFITWGPFKLIRGLNKGRPDKEDLENARKFARDLAKRFM